jgi:hypothetical protein
MSGAGNATCPGFGTAGDIVADYGGSMNGPFRKEGPRIAPPQGTRSDHVHGSGREEVPFVPTNVGDLWRLQEATPS